jgi:hypothetical protein
MRYSHQILIGISLVFSSMAHAIDFYADALYWQASESAEWALTNNLSSTNQVISYKTMSFNFAPGFRVGVGLNTKDWGSRFLYTHYNVGTNDSTSGTVISGFEDGKFVQTFSNSAQVNFIIDFNMFDVDLYKELQVNQSLLFRPLIGLRGGWIKQGINTHFQGQIDYAETINNNFSGFGPKIGLESQWSFYRGDNYRYSLITNVASSFMWGNWAINDSLTQNNSLQISQVLVGKRDFGALAVQGVVGVSLDYYGYLVKVAYEVSDWFNQYQVFDNTTGARNNDLVLQGLTVGLSYRW